MIERVIERGVACGAATAAVAVTDSLARDDGGSRVRESVDRRGVWAVQTPQVFRFDWLWEAHQSAAPDATDDASLMLGRHPVELVEGERGNFKITTAEDYALAQKLLAAVNLSGAL